MMYFWVVHDRGRDFDYICFLFHIVYRFIFIRLFKIYAFIFMFCEINKLFCFACIFRTCVYVFVEYFRNIQVDSVVLLSTLATNK